MLEALQNWVSRKETDLKVNLQGEPWRTEHAGWDVNYLGGIKKGYSD